MIKKIFAAIAAVALAISMVGCSNPNDPTSDDGTINKVTVIYTDRLNFPTPDLSILDKYLTNYATNGGEITFIEADGVPSIVNTVNIPPAPTGYSSETTKKKITERVNSIENVITSMKANDADSNLLGALQLAARSTAPGDTVIVIDNGLITSPDASLTHDFYIDFLDVEASCNNLLNTKEIPDLQGRTVVMYGLGKTDTSGGQEKLSALEIDLLKEFYVNMFELSGASYSFVDTELISLPKEDLSSYPTCNIVPVLKRENQAEQIEQVTAEEEPIVEETKEEPVAESIKLQAFDQATLSFNADSAEIQDEDAAIASLNEVTDYLLSSPDNKIIVAGATSSYGNDPEASKLFSLKRAEAVRSLILANFADISSSQIDVKGLGYTSRFYVKDVDESGRLIPELAEFNRLVYIASVNTDEGQLLRAS